MNLYCISVFLTPKGIEKIIEQCKQTSIAYKKIEITDQTAAKVEGYQLNISDLLILIMPCNDFHKNKDFEIGITEENHEKWTTFIAETQSKYKNECGKFKDEETEYFLFKDENIHGSFFFIFDGYKSNEQALLSIECRMTEKDVNFYNKRISKLIGTNLKDKIIIHKDDCFAIDKITVISKTENITFEINTI